MSLLGLGPSCTYSPLVTLGELGKVVLEYSHDYLGIPGNLGNPLPDLATTFCLKERVGLAVAGIAAGALVSTGSLCVIVKHSVVVLGAALVPAALYLVARRCI
jgi:hypothetical protein